MASRLRTPHHRQLSSKIQLTGSPVMTAPYTRYMSLAYLADLRQQYHFSTSLRVSIHHSTSKTTYQYLHHVPPLPLNGDSPAWLRSCLAHDSLLITLVPITSRNHSTHSPPYGSSCHLLPSLPPSLPSTTTPYHFTCPLFDQSLQ